jgi:hypothetical protein
MLNTKILFSTAEVDATNQANRAVALVVFGKKLPQMRTL